jgi:WD40 repeat protein
MFTLAGHKGAVTALNWRSDSKLLASASEDGSVKLWEMEEGKMVKTWNAHPSGVLSVSYAHDGSLVTCGRDNAVSVWDGTGRKLRDLDKSCDLPLRAVFTSDHTRVIASDFDGQVVAWTVKNGKKLGNLDANPVADTPGQKLATAQR